MLLAHRKVSENGEVIEQGLIDHLLNVAVRSSEKGKKYNLSYTSFLIGLLHDSGKQSLFKSYLEGNYKGRVNHSSAGAKWISQVEINIPPKLNDMFRMYKQIIAYVISAHHGVYDLFDGYDSNLFNRINYDVNDLYDFEGEVKPFIEIELNNFLKDNEFLDIVQLVKESFREFLYFYKEMTTLIYKDGHHKGKIKVTYYRINLFTRFLLALLKEADISDTIAWDNTAIAASNSFNRDELNRFWDESHQNINLKYQNEFKSNTLINITRTNLSVNLLNKSENVEPGIYKLELPTGAGKTISVMRFATRIASKLEKDRLFYITSYLSVLEQNAAEIKDLLKTKNNILEHHSQVVHEKNESENDEVENAKINYLIENWDSPIVITTLVQFFNTLMKNGSSNLRRFSNLANSIIIIDEVQSIPLKSIYHFNEHLNFLANHLNCIVILCTATQPSLGIKSMLAPIYYSENSNLLELNENESKVFKRTINIDLTDRGKKRINTGELASHVRSTIDSEIDSILIVVNTKKSAKVIYESLLSESTVNVDEIYYLTTNLCAAHRKDALKNIKNDLNTGKKIIVVSTQLIEAGINVDFAAVYRSLAGVDSIIQAEGRCNREGKRNTGYLYVFNYTDENLDKLPEIKRAQKAALLALNELDNNTEFRIESLIESYYKFYYSDIENSELDVMEYPYSSNNKKSTLFNLLSMDEITLDAYKKTNSELRFQPMLTHAYKTAGDYFELIDSNTISVIVYYNNEQEINELMEAIAKDDFIKIKELIRLLQPTTINLYNLNNYRSCVSAIFNDRIYLLMAEYYHKDMGLIEENIEALLF